MHPALSQANSSSDRLEPATYRVNYRPSDSDPWQLYAETRSLDKANTIAAGVKESGYQAQVVDDLTPSAQPYPDAAETSASNYYPTSNWASDYNYYIVPGRRIQLRLVRRLEPLVWLSVLSQLLRGTAAVPGTAAMAGPLLEQRLASRRRMEQQSPLLEQQSRRPRHAQRESRAARPERSSDVSRPPRLSRPSLSGPSRGGAAFEQRVVCPPRNWPPRSGRCSHGRASGGRSPRGGACGAGTWRRRTRRRRQPFARPERGRTSRPRITTPEATSNTPCLERAESASRRSVSIDRTMNNMRVSSSYFADRSRRGGGRCRRDEPASAQDPQSRTPEQWLAQLEDADAAKRRQAVVALGSAGPDLTKAMIQQVGAALKDSEPTVRHAAALSLGNFGPASKAALTEIRAAVKDHSPLVRRAAVFALGNLGTAAKAAVPELIAALGDDQRDRPPCRSLCTGECRRGGKGRRGCPG